MARFLENEDEKNKKREAEEAKLAKSAKNTPTPPPAPAPPTQGKDKKGGDKGRPAYCRGREGERGWG